MNKVNQCTSLNCSWVQIVLLRCFYVPSSDAPHIAIFPHVWLPLDTTKCCERTVVLITRGRHLDTSSWPRAAGPLAPYGVTPCSKDACQKARFVYINLTPVPKTNDKSPFWSQSFNYCSSLNQMLASSLFYPQPVFRLSIRWHSW